jgi:thioredoxin 1
MISPTFEEESEKYYPRIKFYKVDVDDSPTIARDSGVTVMPTFVVFRKGERLEALRGPTRNKLKVNFIRLPFEASVIRLLTYCA